MLREPMTDTSNTKTQWQGTTDGLPWMHRALVAVLGKVPIGVIYVFAAVFVVPFYLIGNRRGYLSQYHFFREAFGYGPFKAFRYVCLNHLRFAQVIIDRFAVYGGRRFRFAVEGLEAYNELAEGESGFVQVFSHAGNYELAGYELRQPRKRLYALLFRDGSQTIMENRENVFSPNGVQMVFVQPDMSHIFLLNNVVRDGDIASIPGDRMFGSTKSVECQFMGRQAQFPMGPFQLAVVREAPIVAIFVMKESWTQYRIFVRRLGLSLQGQPAAKRQHTALLAQEFATCLETIVRRYPEQWFNYFDFWQK
ncbi:MAG: acyltransferase [Bacteroidales bacterium]|nr:acyltransferase [Bacteroidales bacterium]